MNYKIYLIFFMILAHIFDDFYLQGKLAAMKQRSFWQDDKNYPAGADKSKYANDWMPALFLHALCWAVMIHLPIMLLYGGEAFVFVAVSVAVNFVIHLVVDHIKCNKFKINLLTDQLIHAAQIAVTCTLAWVVYGF